MKQTLHMDRKTRFVRTVTFRFSHCWTATYQARVPSRCGLSKSCPFHGSEYSVSGKVKLRLANARRVGKWSESRRAAEKAEEEANRPSPVEVRASIARKVEKLRQQVLADRNRKADEWRRLSPEAREAYRTWMALRARDLGGDEGADTALPEWAVSKEELARTAESENSGPKLIEDGSGGERVGVPPSNDWRDSE